LIYIDSSVALAHLFVEDRRPENQLWNETLISSRLLAYEVYSAINARDSELHTEGARWLLSRIALLEMIPEILDRAGSAFPVPVRTLDGMHLASLEFLREQGQDVMLASYDKRMINAAKRLGIAIFDLDQAN
jgi:hypothetical protein